MSMGSCSSPVITSEKFLISLHYAPSERRRIDAFELWCWRRLLRVTFTAKDQTRQSSGKSTLNTHWMDWCWSKNSSILVIWGEQLTHWKSPWFWERLRAEEEGIREWDGWMASPMQEFGQTLGDGEGQGGLACCSLWGHKESDTTGQLNSNNDASCPKRLVMSFITQWSSCYWSSLHLQSWECSIHSLPSI